VPARKHLCQLGSDLAQPRLDLVHLAAMAAATSRSRHAENLSMISC